MVTFTIALLPFVSVSLVYRMVPCPFHGNFTAFPNGSSVKGLGVAFGWAGVRAQHACRLF